MKTYFVYSPRFSVVKIGKSIEVRKRMIRFRMASPDGGLTLLGTIDGDHEAELHERFSDCHSHGEWFFVRKHLADWLREQFGFTLPPIVKEVEYFSRDVLFTTVDRAEAWAAGGLHPAQYPDAIKVDRGYRRSRRLIGGGA